MRTPLHVSSGHVTTRHDEVPQRVAATKCLTRISRALGPERTREELVPFLVDSTDDEDEVLLVMAEALGASLYITQLATRFGRCGSSCRLPQ